MVSGLFYIKKADSLLKEYKKQTIKIYPTPPASFYRYKASNKKWSSLFCL